VTSSSTDLNEAWKERRTCEL